MARRYTRDNRGRFASVGATARGGRLRTASGKKRETQTAKIKGGAASGTIGKANGSRPKVKPAASKPGAIKGARLGGTRQTTRLPAPRNTTPNRTGQSKTLNRFNSRPIGTMVAGKGDKLVPSTKRVPLNINLRESDLAFARVATKASRARAAAPAKAEAKQITANRASRAAANQKRVTQAVIAKGGKRPTPTKKQRRSIMTAEAAKRFYATRAVDTLKVNVKKPGFRLPR